MLDPGDGEPPCARPITSRLCFVTCEYWRRKACFTPWPTGCRSQRLVPVGSELPGRRVSAPGAVRARPDAVGHFVCHTHLSHPSEFGQAASSPEEPTWRRAAPDTPTLQWFDCMVNCIVKSSCGQEGQAHLAPWIRAPAQTGLRDSAALPPRGPPPRTRRRTDRRPRVRRSAARNRSAQPPRMVPRVHRQLATARPRHTD